MSSARILRIEKIFSHDGDDFRTVIFLKGCPLRCGWCPTPASHNPETDFVTDKGKCTRCFTCIDSCPEDAISYNPEKDCFLTDISRCNDCRTCIAGCLSGARTAYGYTATVEEIMQEVEKDSHLYSQSNGGVTISGGEPFMQSDFTRDLLQQCRKIRVNTAIETSAHVPWGTIKKCLPFVNKLFVHLKHMDSKLHKKITGIGNRLILDNLVRIDATPQDFSLILRMPVIPMLNDDDNFITLGRLCKNLKKLQEIRLLPNQRFDIETYKKLSIPYTLEQIATPDNILIESKAEILRQMGLMVRVGS